jgi:hypothetical protein
MFYGAEVAVCWDKYKKPKYSVDKNCNSWMLNLLVHHVTSRLFKYSVTFLACSILYNSSSLHFFQVCENGYQVLRGRNVFLNW